MSGSWRILTPRGLCSNICELWKAWLKGEVNSAMKFDRNPAAGLLHLKPTLYAFQKALWCFVWVVTWEQSVLVFMRFLFHLAGSCLPGLHCWQLLIDILVLESHNNFITATTTWKKKHHQVKSSFARNPEQSCCLYLHLFSGAGPFSRPGSLQRWAALQQQQARWGKLLIRWPFQPF